jgi:hypothetical protein
MDQYPVYSESGIQNGWTEAGINKRAGRDDKEEELISGSHNS